MTVNQISVFLENRPGQLLEVTKILTENGIDLRAINIAETTDYGVARLIVDDSRRAAGVLSAADYVVTPTPVVPVAVPDSPGGLNEVLTVLADEDIDIEYMYSSFGRERGKAYMIFRVAEPDKLEAALAGAGMSSATGAEIGIC